jgi:hypothetical protein
MTPDELLDIARAATPGEWEWNADGYLPIERDTARHRVQSMKDPYFTVAVTLCDAEPDLPAEANARHIATFSPARVIALLEFVQAWDAVEAHKADDSDEEFWVWMERDDELQAALHAKRRALDEA